MKKTYQDPQLVVTCFSDVIITSGEGSTGELYPD